MQDNFMLLSCSASKTCLISVKLWLGNLLLIPELSFFCFLKVSFQLDFLSEVYINPSTSTLPTEQIINCYLFTNAVEQESFGFKCCAYNLLGFLR